MTFLSLTEQAYLGTREFTKAQQRYIRYRINKKLKLLSKELQLFGILKSRHAAASQLPQFDSAVDQPGRGYLIMRRIKEIRALAGL